ncbi:Phospholipase C [Paraburkholderia tropica]|uniref:alkaline phosphatase family protein n=1 Tax=Paraburkholderia tropica TaxID=92647 RepID=UPI001CB20DA2|nr:alkaline phosphatase family protein [Paraburkholderia tropica]CAG9220821.1 Phospholipase C [Paraburkholderia tropica]
MADIAHVFVLMMENRSFDHVFGLAGLEGIAPPPASRGFADGAADRLSTDPPHEFDDVAAQIAGTPPMSGFASGPNAAIAMHGFGAGALPVVDQLAREFVLFDNWFSSMPGPTWPNRFFAHAASSGGLANSPGGLTSAASETIDSLGFSFQNGTLFDRLTAHGKRWRVYHADAFPQVLAIKGLVGGFFHGDTFRTIRPGSTDDAFQQDLNDSGGYDIDYTFIEPSYGLLSANFADGNSQHPVGSMSSGERFIQYVYETIRNAPAIWPHSVLLVTWDEHGGFFDHVPPPAASPPGDADLNSQRAAVPRTFAFDRLGVRVPALLISPWAPRGGTGSALFPGAAGAAGASGAAQATAFDHASIVHSVRELFGLGAPLTQRDAATPSWTGALLVAPRADGDDGPARLTAPPISAAPAAPPAAAALAQHAPLAGVATPTSTQVNGFASIAHALDLQMAQEQSTAPAIENPSLFGARLRGQAPGAATPKAAAPGHPTAQAVADYVAYIAKQTEAHRRRRGRR